MPFFFHKDLVPVRYNAQFYNSSFYFTSTICEVKNNDFVPYSKNKIDDFVEKA